MRRANLAVALAAAALLGACGGDDEQRVAPPGAQTATAPASEEPVVDMNDQLKFVPPEIAVKSGTRVRWRNVGKIAHTVTTTPSKVADRDNVAIPAGAKDFDSGLVGEGEDYARTFNQTGTYRYVCIPHEGAAMVGTVVVER